MPTETSPPQVGVAVAQVGATPGALDQNLEATLKHIASAGRSGHDLVVFPECNLSGYMFDNPQDTRAAAMTRSDPRVDRLVAACRHHDVMATVGILELDGDRVYNSALLLDGRGILGHYRKQHLPQLGADRFVSPGADAGPRVFDTSIGQVGLMICFDLRFPESARVLALEGADIVAMPTAWPSSADFLAEHFTRVRAAENLVHLAVADRGDAENGTSYLGGSRIIGPHGEVLVQADRTEGIFGSTVDLTTSRDKRLVFIPGEYELSLFEQRKPELYGALTRTLEN